jgi:hypothetical protein
MSSSPQAMAPVLSAATASASDVRAWRFENQTGACTPASVKATPAIIA